MVTPMAPMSHIKNGSIMQPEKPPIRLYAVADIHGNPQRLKTVAQVVRDRQPHLLILAGDILNYPPDEGTIHFFDHLNVPTFVVRGNMDDYVLQEWVEKSHHLRWIMNQRVPFSDLILWGLPPDLQGIAQEIATTLPPDQALVMVSHWPPWGLQDQDLWGRRGGSHSLLALIHRYRPLLVLCGHIHEAAGWRRQGETVIVNGSMGKGGSGALIEVRDGRVSGVTMLSSR